MGQPRWHTKFAIQMASLSPLTGLLVLPCPNVAWFPNPINPFWSPTWIPVLYSSTALGSYYVKNDTESLRKYISSHFYLCYLWVCGMWIFLKTDSVLHFSSTYHHVWEMVLNQTVLDNYNLSLKNIYWAPVCIRMYHKLICLNIFYSLM